MGYYVTFTKIVTSSPQEYGAFIRGEISEPPHGFLWAVHVSTFTRPLPF